jgi:hypothetical protein
MKYLIALLFLFIVSSTVNAGPVIFGIGYGKEKINNTLNVDLIKAQGIYRLDNGIIFGANLQKGYPDSDVLPNEERAEGIAGYSTKLNQFNVYSFLSYGHRDRKVTSYNYYTAQIGSRFPLIGNFYGKLAYRFRNTNEANWKTNTYYVGSGVNLSRTVSVELTYGKTDGTYDSDSVSLILINRF